ncbi:LexA family protein [Burkholderia stabilis]|uniref:LexA family protein n=1 Tax=Burkholderia stabilis TaxID=95485 RepID=UPI001E4A36B4|nr:XRE family transcriptional regulator [Burkholderia stabilis]
MYLYNQESTTYNRNFQLIFAMLTTTAACTMSAMEQEDIGAKIAKAREEAGLSQSDLARELGISPQAVQKWESGGKPRPNRLSQIAAILGTSVRNLIRNTPYEEAFAVDLPIDEVALTEAKARAKAERRETRQIEKAAYVGKLPLISWVQAGDWSEIVDNFHPGDAEDWILCPFNHGPSAFILRVVGESMYDPSGPKSYAPGDYIAVDPSREAVNRSMVVVRLLDDEKATFKQLIVDPDGTKMLKALNPNWPKPFIEINGNAKIVGTVIGKWVPE